jgi:hypothetical protein
LTVTLLTQSSKRFVKTISVNRCGFEPLRFVTR